MSEKKCVWLIVLWQILGLLMMFLILVFINPLEIWAIRPIKGFNHYKYAQVNHSDLSKTYQYLHTNAETVYIGASTTYVGIKPKDGRTFNFGLNSLNLVDTKNYIEFIVKINKPKKIILEINPQTFSKHFHFQDRPGFSKERLKLLTKNGIARGFEILQETLSTYKLVKETVKQSRTKKNENILFLNGWESIRGGAREINIKDYLAGINRNVPFVEKYEFEPESIECLKDIIELIENNRIEVVIFWAPMSIDYLAIMDAKNRLDYLYYIKETVNDIYPSYDFAWSNNIAQDRNLFYDLGHYRAVAGDIVQGVLDGKIPPDGLVTNNYEEQKLAYEKWKEKKENSEYVELLKNAKENIPDDILTKHLNLK